MSHQYTNGIAKQFTERLPEITDAVLRKARQRTADVSASLTRRNAAQATAVLLNESVLKLIGLLYQTDADGVLCNVNADGRIEIPAPWGSTGRPRYGLRRTEGDTLRRYVQHLETIKRPVRLFYFDEEASRWYLDIFTYPTQESALVYWQIVAMNAAAWRRFNTQKGSE